MEMQAPAWELTRGTSLASVAGCFLRSVHTGRRQHLTSHSRVRSYPYENYGEDRTLTRFCCLHCLCTLLVLSINNDTEV